MYATQPDQVLLTRFAQSRDEQAFAEIVRRYSGLVYATGRRILGGDGERARDVSQETFLRLARRPWGVSHSLPGWLHTAATQIAIDNVRSEGARQRREARYAREHDEQRSEASADEVIQSVDACLAKLPPAERDLLVRHFLSGQSQRDLATEAGVSAATLCRRIEAALELLRAKLGRRGVAVGATLLVGCLTNQSAQAAAPPVLQMQLGKLSLASGSRLIGSSPLPTAGVSAVMLKLAVAVVLAAGLVWLGILLAEPQAQTWWQSPPPKVMHEK